MKRRTITSEYHFSVTQIKRSAGQSAIAAAAYRAGEKLHSDYYGQDSDYTRKSGVVDKGVLLPSHVPRQYSDRQVLWNEVEKAEKHPKAQLAYSFDFALQNEFSMEENIAIAREFIQRNFVDLGMIADYAIHLPDPKDGRPPNPHVHVMCPIRPMEPGGKWGAKQKRLYRLNADGSRACDAKGRELFDARPTTDWGTPERLETWRHAWAEINNTHFAQHGLDARIDNRSFEKQGIPQIPTIHEGPNVREMERRGIRTEKGDRNRWIRHINTVIRTIGKRLKELAAFIERLKEELRRQAEPTVNDFLAAYYDERNATAWGQVFRARNLHEYSILFSYLQEHGIVTLTDLDEHNKALSAQADPVKTQLSELRARLTALDGIIKAGARYETNKPVYEKWSGIFFKKAKEKFAGEHSRELKSYHAARRQVKDYLNEKGEFDKDRVEWERDKVIKQMDQIDRDNAPLREQLEMLRKINAHVRHVIDAEDQNRGNYPDSGIEETKPDKPEAQHDTSKKKGDYTL